MTSLDHAGRPIVGQQVWLDRVYNLTDAEGRVVWDSVETGTRRITSKGVGHLPASAEVEILANEVTRVVLREPEPALLDLHVVGPDGTPLPFARVEVHMQSTLPWIDVENGVQRLDSLTDERGQRRLHHLESGKVTLDVEWGEWHRRVELAVEDGANPDVVVVLGGED